MNSIHRMMINICSKELEQSKQFYTQLFDFTVNFDSDWFVQLISQDQQLELGIISQSSEIVPQAVPATSGGYYITFVVENADAVFELAKQKQIEIIQEPEDTFYGQRRLLLKDPNGVIVDVSSVIAST